MSSPDSSDPLSSAAPAVGQMAALVRAKDWAATPVGPPEAWPPSLRVIVATMLASKFPMAVRWGPDFVLIYNDGYRPILGDKHPGALGLPFRQIWPEVQARMEPLHQGILSGERSGFYSEDLLLSIRRHGDTLEDAHFTVGYSPIPDDTAPSGVGGILVTAIETTGRVQIERRLRDREAELERVQEIGQVGGLEVFLTGGFTNRRSPEYLKIHGLPPTAWNETHEDWVRRIHPEDREENEEAFIRAVRGDATEYNAEYRIIRPSDGQVRWIQVRSQIERDREGHPLRLVGAHIDITERKQAEQALRKLNETLEQQVAERTRERDRLWRVSDDLIGVANARGYWDAINPAATAILGWSEAELLAMPISDLWHPADVEETLIHRERLKRGGRTERFQNRYRHKDGSYRWLAWASTGEGGYIYALARDVTAEREAADALRRTEEQLRQAQKMEAVGQLTGGIAHDFNNLLTGVIGSLDLMQRRIAQGQTDRLERYATAAMTAANRAAALTHRLLALSRPPPPHPQPVHANP